PPRRGAGTARGAGRAGRGRHRERRHRGHAVLGAVAPGPGRRRRGGARLGGGEVIRRFDVALPHGITLACRGAGSGRARVLMLPGFPEAAFAWDETLERLAPAVAGVAPNLRGYPGSSAPAGVTAYHARHLVDDLAALIEALGAPLDLLVAHDWGGAL